MAGDQHRNEPLVMIALVASTFPRFAGDSAPRLILEFARELSGFFDVMSFSECEEESNKPACIYR